MRIVDLGRTALQAEILRYKALAARNVRRVVLVVVAAVFALSALAGAEFALFFVLDLDARITPAWSALIVGGIDIAIALVLVLAASAGGPGAVEIEARITRDRALSELRSAAALATVTGPAGRLAGRGVIGLIRKAFARRRRPLR